MSVCGFIGGKVFRRLEIHVSAYQRLVSLTELTDVPWWLDLGPSPVASKRVIATTDPGWFDTFNKELL